MTLQSTVFTQITLKRNYVNWFDLKLLKPVFQPIMALENPRIIGYEVLIRSSHDNPLKYRDKPFRITRESACSLWTESQTPVAELSAQILPLSAVLLRRYQDHFVRTAGEIVVDSVHVSPQSSAESLVKMFRVDVRLTCVPVVDGENALGMVSRAEMLKQEFVVNLFKPFNNTCGYGAMRLFYFSAVFMWRR